MANRSKLKPKKDTSKSKPLPMSMKADFQPTVRRAKSDKIKIIRQQYDAFLDEDKKRKERNEYIINRLDKMRCCDYVVPYRPKVHYVNDNYITQSYNRFAHIPQPPMENRASRSQMALSTVDLSIKSIDESVLLKEISKKYILIPKLKNAADNNELLSSEADVKPSSYDDTDWKSKYDILNQLKQEEKEDIKTPDHVDMPKDKVVPMFDSELNEESIDIHSSPSDKSFYKYDDEPVRDDKNFETKKPVQKLNEEQNCETDSTHDDLVNSTADAILAIHRNSIGINKDSPEILAVTPEGSESTKNNSDMIQNIVNAVISKEQRRLREVAAIEENNTQPHINTETHDAIIEESDVQKHQLENDQVYETHPKDYDVTNYAEDEGTVEYAKEDYQYAADPNIAHEQIACTDVVQPEQENQVEPQGYEQQMPSEYNQAHYAEGENVAHVNENYTYEDNNQQYYNDPIAQGQYQEQEYQGQEYQGQEYQGQEYQEPEYQEPVYQGHEYQDQFVTETQEYSDQPQYEQNAIINETNTHEQPVMQPEPIENTCYAETPNVQDNVPIENTSVGQENEYNENVIHPTQNPDYVEDIQEFESEANLYNNIDPNGIVADESTLQQPITQEDYNVFYEDNQMAQDPLDANDHDATLQQYDQSYEAQYTGNYEEQVPIVENVPGAYEPVQTQEPVQYEDESLAKIEKTLDNEQGYAIDADVPNISDAVPNKLQQANEQANEQPKDQKPSKVSAAVKKEMLMKNN